MWFLLTYLPTSRDFDVKVLFLDQLPYCDVAMWTNSLVRIFTRFLNQPLLRDPCFDQLLPVSCFLP